MFWLRRQTPAPLLRPQSPNIDDHDTYIIIDAATPSPPPSPPPSVTIMPLTDTDLLDCLKVLTSYPCGDTMPLTPSNTPTSTHAQVFDDAAFIAFLGTPPKTITPSPPAFDGLSAITSFASFDECVDVPLAANIEDIDVHDDASLKASIQSPVFCTSLTPMLIHGGIPITFMLMAQMGLAGPPGGKR